MDRFQFEKAFALMDKYHARPLLGIIPSNKDKDQMIDDSMPDFWSFIKQLQEKGYSIAMHGFIHVYDQTNPATMICGRKHSEFAGNTYDVQYEKIKQGKEILLSHGIITDVFFAPAHTYDRNTLKALYANGFKYMCDGLSIRPYVQEGIICIPCKSFGVPHKSKKGINIAVCHPSEWSRTENATEYDTLVRFCERYEPIDSFETLKTVKCGCYLIEKTYERIIVFLKRVKRLLLKN